MASKLEITTRLLKRTGHDSVERFVATHAANGGDATSLKLALLMATGLDYDLTVCETWLHRYRLLS